MTRPPAPAAGAPPVEVIEVCGPDGAPEGWLVVDTLSNGLAFGGCRFSPSCDRGEVERLARCMTWKLSAHGLPVGGAKAGLRCDPRAADLPDRLARFAAQAGDALRSRALIGKDMGATDAILDALYDAVGTPQLGLIQPGAPDGPPVPDRLRDLTGYRHHMTGLGVAWATAAALGERLEGARIAIQGFGLVGAGTAVRLTGLGARVVAVSDATGAVLGAGALDVDALLAAASATKGVIDRTAVSGAPTLAPPDALFDVDADVLVLAASSWSVRAEAAERIAAPLVVEGSNFGLTPDARAILHRRGRTVLPDLLASSSSAAMVAHQLATRNGRSAGALWADIEGAIREHVTIGLADADRAGVDVRTAYLRRITDAG